MCIFKSCKDAGEATEADEPDLTDSSDTMVEGALPDTAAANDNLQHSKHAAAATVVQEAVGKTKTKKERESRKCTAPDSPPGKIKSLMSFSTVLSNYQTIPPLNTTYYTTYNMQEYASDQSQK